MKERKEGSHFRGLLRITKLPWLLLAITCIVCIGENTLRLILPDISSKLLAGEFTDGNIKTMVWVLSLGAIALALRQFLMAISQGWVTFAFRKSVFAKILRLKPEYFESTPFASLISRATLDTTMLSDFIVGAVCFMPTLLYTFFASFAIIFSYNWRLVVLEAALIPILFFITWLNGRVQFKWYNLIQAKLAELSAFLAERLLNIPMMKLFVTELSEEHNGLNAIGGLYTTQKRYVFRLFGVNFLMEFENVVQSVVIVVGGVFLIHRGYINLQQWIAFYVYAGGLIGSVQQLLDYWGRYKQMTGSSKRIADIAVAPEEGCGGDQPMPNEARDLVFDQVAFAYEGEHRVLQDVDMTIRAGKKTFIVGRSGAGKSTLLYMIERFFQPNAGKILYGDTDISQYSFDSWRGSIAYVPQTPTLFSGTIRENILYGVKRQVTDGEMKAALKSAQLWEFIQSTQDGLDTPVGENGSKLSGGQRQRVILARVFLLNPRIILLDEATSSLDAEAKEAVNNCFDELAEGRTVIVVTHDIRDCDRADEIVVVDHGRIDAWGPRQEIMEKNRIFQMLKNTQTGEAVAEHG